MSRAIGRSSKSPSELCSNPRGARAKAKARAEAEAKVKGECTFQPNLTDVSTVGVAGGKGKGGSGGKGKQQQQQRQGNGSSSSGNSGHRHHQIRRVMPSILDPEARMEAIQQKAKEAEVSWFDN